MSSLLKGVRFADLVLWFVIVLGCDVVVGTGVAYLPVLCYVGCILALFLVVLVVWVVCFAISSVCFGLIAVCLLYRVVGSAFVKVCWLLVCCLCVLGGLFYMVVGGYLQVLYDLAVAGWVYCAGAYGLLACLVVLLLLGDLCGCVLFACWVSFV